MLTSKGRANNGAPRAWVIRCLCLVAALIATAQVSAATITLAWDPPTGPAPAGYFVHYGPAAGNYTTKIDVGNVTTYVVSGLVAGSTYHFAATDYDASRTESGFSNDVSATLPGIPPVAQFTGSPVTGVAPLTVNFVNSSTGSIAGYAWTFGDGTTSNAANPSHVYSKSGVYTVTLTATGSGGSNTQTISNYVMVAMPTIASAPVAQFSGTPVLGASPLSVNFTNASTGSITSYAWDFGDGTTSPVANPSHVYSTAGAYTVSLTVTGSGGSNTQTLGNYVNVMSPVPAPAPAPAPVPVPTAANYQGLWWNAPANSESGWGLSLTHNADTIFAAWFTYDTNGRGWWLVMTALKTAPNVYSGRLYQAQGPPFTTPTFDPAAVARAEVGTGTLAFSDANNGTFSYAITNVSPGIAQTKNITREVFGPQPTCTYGTQPNLAMATNYQDLWWAAPAGSESGWGVNFSHQGNQIFLTWFTYDVDGQPMWLAATTTQTANPSVYAGTLFRTSGPRFDAFDPASVKNENVGSATLTFFDGNNAKFDYAITGIGASVVAQSKTITREVLVAPGTTCQ